MSNFALRYHPDRPQAPLDLSRSVRDRTAERLVETVQQIIGRSVEEPPYEERELLAEHGVQLLALLLEPVVAVRARRLGVTHQLVEQLVLRGYLQKPQVGVLAMSVRLDLGPRLVLLVVFSLGPALAVEVQAVDAGVAAPVDLVVQVAQVGPALADRALGDGEGALGPQLRAEQESTAEVLVLAAVHIVVVFGLQAELQEDVGLVDHEFNAVFEATGVHQCHVHRIPVLLVCHDFSNFYFAILE